MRRRLTTNQNSTQTETEAPHQAAVQHAGIHSRTHGLIHSEFESSSPRLKSAAPASQVRPGTIKIGLQQGCSLCRS